jgi:hypothetical protein
MFLDVECFHGYRLTLRHQQIRKSEGNNLTPARPPSKRNRVGIGTIFDHGVLELNAQAWQVERRKFWRLHEA